MMTETVVNVQEAPNNNATPNKQQTAPADSPLSWIKLNVDYFKTTPGLLKIAELVSFPRRNDVVSRISSTTQFRAGQSPAYVELFFIVM